jgi:serine/threonine protein kinase
VRASFVDGKVLQVRRRLVTPAVDWWALGCVLYQLIRGLPPYALSKASLATAKVCVSENKTIMSYAVSFLSFLGCVDDFERNAPIDCSASADDRCTLFSVQEFSNMCCVNTFLHIADVRGETQGSNECKRC